MNTKEMREALLKYYETEGPDRSVALVRGMSDEDVAKNYERLLVEEAFEKARDRLDEDTKQKLFDLDKGRSKIT